MTFVNSNNNNNSNNKIKYVSPKYDLHPSRYIRERIYIPYYIYLLNTYICIYILYIYIYVIWWRSSPSKSRSCVTIDFFSGPNVFLFSRGRVCASLPINRWRRPIFATAVAEIGSWRRSGGLLWMLFPYDIVCSSTQKRSVLFPKHIINIIKSKLQCCGAQNFLNFVLQIHSNSNSTHPQQFYALQ